jgi:phage terminase large subunit
MADKKPYTKSHVDRVKFWKTHPLEWVIDFFGENIRLAQRNRGIDTGTVSGLSSQQEDALRQWGALIEAKLRLAAGKELSAEQEALSGRIGMSIMSGMGTGKDFLAALITWHFMYCFSFPKILATANTGKQLNEVFWSELAKVRGMARKVDPQNPDSLNDLQANFEMQSEILFARLPNKEERGKRWFCSAVTINTKATAEQQGEALAGRHEDHMLFVIDEASGIPEPVFKPIEKTLTGKLNLVFMIFNPTQNTGFAIRSQNEQRDKWVCLHWDARESENVTKASIRNLEMYGKDSPDYRIGVLGLPPLADSNALIPYEWIQRAIGREFDNENDPVMSGADVGGGGDKSVFCFRQGGVVCGFKTSNSKDTTVVADWVGSSMDEEDAAVVFVDVIGLGKGTYDNLRRLNYNARPADARNTADDEDRFFNKRAEQYWKLRDQFEKNLISLPVPADERDAADPIVRLIRELGAIKNETVGKKNKIGDKKEIKKVIGFSPDYADALCYTYWKPDSLFRKMKDKKNGRKVEMKNVFLR